MNHSEKKDQVHLSKREKHLRRSRNPFWALTPSMVLLWSGALLIFGFYLFGDPSQNDYSDLIVSIGYFLIMFSFIYHRGEMRGRGITLSGKPAEIVRKIVIIVTGMIGTYLLLHYLNLL